MVGVVGMASSDSLFRRALLFSLATHLATLAWVQTPQWETTPPPLVIVARLEAISEPAGPLPESRPIPVLATARPLPAPVYSSPTTVAPAPVSTPTPTLAPLTPSTPITREAVSSAPVALIQPVSRPSAAAVALPVAQPGVAEVPRFIPDGEYYPARKLDAIPRRLGSAQPKYPEAAQRRGVTGNLKVRLKVNALGEVETVEIVSAQPEGVFDATVRAFFQLARYQPPQREGHPVRAVIEERVSFTLNDDF